ncbi:MAG: pilus assembly protein [Acidobacteria bacterium]|nr:pilus assembly protein [Acidobacteriota bacterium]
MKKLIPRGNKGNTILEFALGSVVMVAAFLGAFQYGYIFYRYNTIENAVNAGSRYAAMRPYDSTTSTPSTGFSTAVKNMVVYGNPAGGTTPIAPGLSTANVAVTPVFTSGVPTSMKVYITGYTIDAGYASQKLTGKPVATYGYIGIYSPYY